MGSVHLLAFSAWSCSLAFLFLGDPFLAICSAVFIYLVLFSGLFSGLSLFSDSVDFSFSNGNLKKKKKKISRGFFMGLLLPRFSSFLLLYSF